MANLTALDQLTADARLAVELREEAETHRIEGSDDYFCGGRLMRAAADAIERLQNSSAPETSEPRPNSRFCAVHGNHFTYACPQCPPSPVKTTCEPGP